MITYNSKHQVKLECKITERKAKLVSYRYVISTELLSAYCVQICPLSHIEICYLLTPALQAHPKLYPCINLLIYQYSISVDHKVFYRNLIAFISFMLTTMLCGH